MTYMKAAYIITFNMFDGELQYQNVDIANGPNFRLYISSYGFANHYSLMVF